MSAFPPADSTCVARHIDSVVIAVTTGEGFSSADTLLLNSWPRLSGVEGPVGLAGSLDTETGATPQSRVSSWAWR